MFSWLIAVIAPQLKQMSAPPTSTLDLTGADLTMFNDGTNCGNLATAEITLTFTGSGTVTVELNENGAGFALYSSNVSTSAFPYIVEVQGYYNTSEPLYTLEARITNEGNGADVEITPERSNTLFVCA